MNEEYIIKVAGEFVRRRISGYDSGHDWWHIERVRKLALYINTQEKMADPFLLDIAALLHDSIDSKFAGKDSLEGYRITGRFLDNNGLTGLKNRILDIIRNVSFSNKNPSGNLSDPVLLVIQDADKLDAIGAIGIARAFNYGGFRNNSIYIPGDQSANDNISTVKHFYEKLLKLKDMMNTKTGLKIAEERHLFLEIFLEHFYSEWNFNS